MRRRELDELIAVDQHQPVIAEPLDQALTAARAPGEGDVARSLRQERLGLALVLGLGDMAGHFPLSVVMGELSALADRALDRAIAAVIARRMPGKRMRVWGRLAQPAPGPQFFTTLRRSSRARG